MLVSVLAISTTKEPFMKLKTESIQLVVALLLSQVFDHMSIRVRTVSLSCRMERKKKTVSPRRGRRVRSGRILGGDGASHPGGCGLCLTATVTTDLVWGGGRGEAGRDSQ